jgi:hypothetical protein
LTDVAHFDLLIGRPEHHAVDERDRWWRQFQVTPLDRIPDAVVGWQPEPEDLVTAVLMTDDRGGTDEGVAVRVIAVMVRVDE